MLTQHGPKAACRERGTLPAGHVSGLSRRCLCAQGHGACWPWLPSPVCLQGQSASWALNPNLKIITTVEDREGRSKQSISRMAESP